MKHKLGKEKIYRYTSILIALLVIFFVMPKNRMIVVAVPSFTVSEGSIKASGANCQPISVTGFDKDFIAEDGEGGKWGKPSNYTSDITINKKQHVLYTENYYKKYSSSVFDPGIPDNGVFISHYTGSKYQLQPYDENNILYMPSGSEDGTLTFNQTDISTYKQINILAISANYPSIVDVTVNFISGSSVAFSGKEVKEWELTSSTDYAAKGMGRVQRNNGFGYYGDAPERPRLYDIVLDLKAEDQDKEIKSITFHHNSTSKGNLAIFAVSGEKVKVATAPDIPLLTEVTDITTDSAVLNWNMVNNATQYKVDVAADESFSSSSILKDYNNSSVNQNSVNITGLKSDTVYYYRVRAKNAFGTSASSKVGSFKTLPYEVWILKHPDSLIVEENNINETLSVEVDTNSKKELNFTWYLCSDEAGKDIIQRETTGLSYEVPSNLTHGDYYVYCEIYNEDVKAVKTEIAKISVQVLYNFDLSWGEMKFEFGPNNVWDPDSHSYIGEDTYGWKSNGVDGENNKITISNHSSSSLPMSIEYVSKEGVFNKNFDADTSVQGRFYDNNEEAVIASEYLDNLTERLNFGKEFIEEVIETDKWTGPQDSKKFMTYFTFSGMPDLSIIENRHGYFPDNVQELTAVEEFIKYMREQNCQNSKKFQPFLGINSMFSLSKSDIILGNLSEYKTVGCIKIKFQTVS